MIKLRHHSIITLDPNLTRLHKTTSIECFTRSGQSADADEKDDNKDADDGDGNDDDKDKVRLCFTREQSGGSDRYCSQIAHSATTLTHKYKNQILLLLILILIIRHTVRICAFKCATDLRMKFRIRFNLVLV